MFYFSRLIHCVARARRLPEVWRSPIVTVLERSLFVKSVVSKRAQSFWSASCRFSAWFARLLRILRRTFVFNPPPFLPFRRPQRVSTLLLCKDMSLDMFFSLVPLTLVFPPNFFLNCQPTWLACSRTPIFAPFTPSVLQSCPRFVSPLYLSVLMEMWTFRPLQTGHSIGPSYSWRARLVWICLF